MGIKARFLQCPPTAAFFARSMCQDCGRIVGDSSLCRLFPSSDYRRVTGDSGRNLSYNLAFERFVLIARRTESVWCQGGVGGGRAQCPPIRVTAVLACDLCTGPSLQGFGTLEQSSRRTGLFASLRPIRAVHVSLIVLLLGGTSVHGQTVASAVSAVSAAGSGSAGITPAEASKPSSPEAPPVGLNLGVSNNFECNSSTGWSDIVSPDLSLQINRHLSVDAGIPWYSSLAAYVSTSVNGVTTTSLTQVHNVVGDTAVTAHAGGSLGDFNLSGDAAAGFATGDKSLGVGAGETTYHLGTHAEYSVGPFVPDVEAGIGNSSAFANRQVRKSYMAVGAIANFQTGTSIDLPKELSLDVEGYEALPIELATVFGTINRRGNHGHGGGKKTLQGASTSTEDNGFTMDLSFPLTHKLAFSADYSYSLIQAEHIIGFSLAWVLRWPGKREANSPVSPLSHQGN